MRGAIFFASKYGSTKQYAIWISKATGLPLYDINEHNFELEDYDFFILGGPILYYKLYNRKWINNNWSSLKHKPIIMFTVSGVGSGEKLEGWIANSDLPEGFISKVKHVALRGRQIPKELTWFDRMMLRIAAMRNPDPIASKEERYGFDYMDESTIEPILKLIDKLQSEKDVTTPQFTFE